ncbi:MAG TPA: SH3 domain-containing protein [Candidatus Koribacter sp.]
MAAKRFSMANNRISIRCSGRKSTSSPTHFGFRQSALVRVLGLLAVILVVGTAAAENRKSNHESPNSLQLMVNAPLNDVVAAVEQVSGDEVIYGTQSFQRERNLMGARRTEHSSAFGDTTAPGTILYKVADSVLAPTNFKNSADMGTLTVRYIVSKFDENNSNLRIDAVFIENASRKIHDSDGSVETAEYGEVRKHVEEIAAQHELDREQAERIAKERKEKQAELDLAARRDAALTVAKTTGAPLSADLEQRVAQLRKQAEMRVAASGTQLRTAPYKAAAKIQTLPPYTDVVVLIVTPYWYGIQTADGHRGWIHHSELETIP